MRIRSGSSTWPRVRSSRAASNTVSPWTCATFAQRPRTARPLRMSAIPTSLTTGRKSSGCSVARCGQVPRGPVWRFRAQPGSSHFDEGIRSLRRARGATPDAMAATPAPDVDGLALDGTPPPGLASGEGETEIGFIARALGTSSRTLQRRLSVAGMSYQRLLDAVRRDTAERCMVDPSLSIGEVSYLIGLEPAAVHRAFSDGTG